MDLSFPNIPYLDQRIGPSPEIDHEYQCHNCDNQTRFVGIDDRGLPGKEYTCPHCGQPAVGNYPNGPERCWCPAYARFEQPFYAQGPGIQPDYDTFQGGQGASGELHAYTRILCQDCQDLVWVDPREGLGGAADRLLERRDGPLAGQELAFLQKAIHLDLRGVLETVERNPRGATRTWAEKLEPTRWQEALDRTLAASFYEGTGCMHFSSFLRERASLDPALLNLSFNHAFRTNPLEALAYGRHRELLDQLDLQREAFIASMTNYAQYHNDIVEEMQKRELTAVWAHDPDVLQEVLDRLAPHQPSAAVQTRRDNSELDLELNTEQLQIGLLRWLNKRPQNAVEWLEEHRELAPDLLDTEHMKTLMTLENEQLRGRALRLLSRARQPKNPAPQETARRQKR